MQFSREQSFHPGMKAERDSERAVVMRRLETSVLSPAENSAWLWEVGQKRKQLGEG